MPGNPFDQFDSGGYRTEKQLGQQVASLPSERSQQSQESPWIDQNLDAEIARTKDPKAKATLLAEKDRRAGVAGGGNSFDPALRMNLGAGGGNPFDQFDPAAAQPQQPAAAPAGAPAAPTGSPSMYDKYMPDALKGPLGGMREAVGAVAEPLMALGSGMVAKPVSDVVGLAALPFAAMTNNRIGDPQKIKEDVQRGLTYQPRTQAGQAVNEYNPLALLGKAVGWTADKAGGAVKGENPGPLRDALGNLVHEGIEQGPGLLGIKAPPVAAAAASGLKEGARGLMSSALKPGERARRTGDATRAVDTLLDEGINVSKGGLEKLRDRINTTNDRIAALIENSPATIDKVAATQHIGNLMDRFLKQVTPMEDIKAIQKAYTDFLDHPLLEGRAIPVQTAQEIKQGTYRSLGDKSYGELKGADIEAQKALARGIKDEIAKMVPEVRTLNAQDSKLLNALPLVERRVLAEANKNPIGLGILSHNPAHLAAWMADRSGAFKSIVARMLNTGSEIAPALGEYGPALGMAVGAQAQRQ